MDKKDRIKVKALPAFMNRRGKTLDLSSADYRKLKAGGAVLIDKELFDKTLYKEVKDGNKQDRVSEL